MTLSGEKLLIAGNAGEEQDAALFTKLGLTPMAAEQRAMEAAE